MKRSAIRAIPGIVTLALIGACGSPLPPAQPEEADYLAQCDLPSGLSAYCSACAGGSAGACLAVARAYERGEQLGRDPLGMVAFERQACDLGSGRGCTNLAGSYRSGEGVERRSGQADALWNYGCGLAERTCNKEQLAYECVAASKCRSARNEPLERRHVEQAEVACEGGDRVGCEVAVDAAMRGPEVDPAEIAGLFVHMCESGGEFGCEAVAMQQWLGLGVVADPEAARATFARLCAGGLQSSCHAERGYMHLLLVAPFIAGAATPYPHKAIAAAVARSRGPVKDGGMVGFCVAPDGTTDKPVVLDSSGSEEVDGEVLAAVETWRFPSRLDTPQAELCMQTAFLLPRSR
ncbi:hypothetical protein OV079_39855 [Nannocystis pusilla]|uniref:Beta-lactamase n=1 Tax=Nannocystis pusilla TaxID=889268 RepID=A0A9X3EY33_9BACT|nr:hypothetical protein [Nannocystis pusilla]MCY1011615.1 hypothetical protein [Nannocystis pusilla]